MRSFYKVALVSLLSLSLVACGSKSTVESKVDAKTVYGCNTLNVYNWGEYIGPDVISNFEKMYNAKVNYDLYESNEIMYTKLMGGSSYDVLIPSDYMIERLIKEDLIQPLDKNIVKNFDQLSPEVKNLSYDKDNTYSAPYLWGSFGILYNKNNVDPAQVEKEGYNILLDSKYKGKVYLYDSERDGFMIALKALGYSMNTENQDEIKEAYDWLIKVKETVEPAFVTDEVIDAMANGEKDIAIMYSGDSAFIMTQNEDMVYFEPESGTNVWSDAMVIPKNAGCPGLANEFINYAMSYEVSLETSRYVGYTSTNEKAMKELSTGDYEGIGAYTPRKNGPKDEIFKYNDVLKKELSDLWIKVKNN